MPFIADCRLPGGPASCPAWAADEQLYISDPARRGRRVSRALRARRPSAQAIRFLRLAADGAAARFANQEAARHPGKRDPPDRASRGGRADVLSRWTSWSSGRSCGCRPWTWKRRPPISPPSMPQARLEGNVNRRVKALIGSVMPWGFLDYPALSGRDRRARG